MKKRLITLLLCALPSVVLAQENGWSEWQNGAYNLNGCGDCSMNGTWGQTIAYVHEIGVVIAVQTMNLDCCYAGAYLQYSVPLDWPGLDVAGPPERLRLRPAPVGPYPGGLVFRNFYAGASGCDVPTGDAQVHGFLGGGSSLYQCAACSGTHGQSVQLGNGFGAQMVRVQRADPPQVLGEATGNEDFTPSMTFEGSPDQDNFFVKIQNGPPGGLAVLEIDLTGEGASNRLTYGVKVCPPFDRASLLWHLGSHWPYDWAARESRRVATLQLDSLGGASVNLSAGTNAWSYIATFARGRWVRLQWWTRHGDTCYQPVGVILATEYLLAPVACH